MLLLACQSPRIVPVRHWMAIVLSQPRTCRQRIHDKCKPSARLSTAVILSIKCDEKWHSSIWRASETCRKRDNPPFTADEYARKTSLRNEIPRGRSRHSKMSNGSGYTRRRDLSKGPCDPDSGAMPSASSSATLRTRAMLTTINI